MDQILLQTLQGLTDALNETNARIDKLEARLDHLVGQIDEHLEVQWATKKDIEAIRLGIWRECRKT